MHAKNFRIRSSITEYGWTNLTISGVTHEPWQFCASYLGEHPITAFLSLLVDLCAEESAEKLPKLHHDYQPPMRYEQKLCSEPGVCMLSAQADESYQQVSFSIVENEDFMQPEKGITEPIVDCIIGYEDFIRAIYDWTAITFARQGMMNLRNNWGADISSDVHYVIPLDWVLILAARINMASIDIDWSAEIEISLLSRLISDGNKLISKE